MRQRRLPWYRPGMISLALLPILCLFHLKEKGVFREYRLMPVFRITKEFYEPPKSEGVIYFKPPERQDLEIWLNGNEEQARANLDAAQYFLHQLVIEQDTVKGIHFKFSNEAKYWMFVRALDLCRIDEAQHFVTLENNIRAYFQELKTPDPSTILRPLLMGCIAWNKDDSDRAVQRAKRRAYIACLGEFWPLVLVFSALSINVLFPKLQIPANK